MLSSNIILLKVCFSFFIIIIEGNQTSESDDGSLTDSLILELYRKYKEAVSNDADLIILRRQFDQNRLFEIHIKKLKEVNGFKQHNLLIKGKARSGSNPFIYINNPVESRLPNAYLTLEEFKEALTKRVEKQRYSLTTQRQNTVFNGPGILKKRKSKLRSGASVIYNNNKYSNNNVFKITTKKRKSNEIKKATIVRTTKDTTLFSQSTREVIKFHKTHSPEDSSSKTHPFKSEVQSEYNPKTTHSTNNYIKPVEDITTGKIEDLIFLRASQIDNNHTEIEESSSFVDTMNTTLEKIDYDEEGSTNVTVADALSINDKDNLNNTDDTIILTSNGTESFNASTVLTLNETTHESVANITMKTVETKLEDSAVLTNATEVSVTTQKAKPKRLVSSIETVPFSRHTPWRKKQPYTRITTKKKTTITRRSTLGRPLVFIGGP